MKLTDMEVKLLGLLGKKPKTSADLVGLLYGALPPFNATQLIVGRMRTIIRKLDAMGDARKILKSERRGPHPISFWVERR